MANKKTSELKDLEPLDRQTNDEKHERRDMREIPKTSIKKEQKSSNVFVRATYIILS